MIRIVNFLLIAFMIVGVATVYDRKFKSERASKEVAELRHKISIEHDRISMLEAEWSVLRQPARLQKLVERYNNYLKLKPLDAVQIVSFDELPTKPLDLSPSDDNRGPLGGYAGDPDTTVIR